MMLCPVASTMAASIMLALSLPAHAVSQVHISRGNST